MSVFRKWIQSLSSYAVSKFLRAASLGVQLNESWIIGSAAAYIWNYSKHMMCQQRQQEVVSSLQTVLDAVKAVEIPRYIVTCRLMAEPELASSPLISFSVRSRLVDASKLCNTR